MAFKIGKSLGKSLIVPRNEKRDVRRALDFAKKTKKIK